MARKYGYNDYDWDEHILTSPLQNAVKMFNVYGFIPFLKRKTYDEFEVYMLKCLKEMVEILEEELKNKKYKSVAKKVMLNEIEAIENKRYTTKEIKKIEIEEVKAIYKERFNIEV